MFESHAKQGQRVKATKYTPANVMLRETLAAVNTEAKCPSPERISYKCPKAGIDRPGEHTQSDRGGNGMAGVPAMRWQGANGEWNLASRPPVVTPLPLEPPVISKVELTLGGVLKGSSAAHPYA